MGLLILGKPYKWKDMKQYQAYVKKHGVAQFLNVWNIFKDRSSDRFLWGDEIECIVLSIDPKKKTARIALRASEILADLEKVQEEAEKREPGSAYNVTFHPEYGNFMVEATPGAPYGGYTYDLRMVESNMRLRRCLIQSKLNSDELLVTMSNYPLLGTPNFTKPHFPITGVVCKSSYIPDQLMSPHPRFAALSGNIRRRRGKRVNIKMPLYIDKNTNVDTAAGNVLPIDERPELMPTNTDVHMDAMAFGMGCCCLQVTFQTRSISEARHLYDQLAVISPILLALTASTPIHRGRVCDTDVRWDVISQAVDDRTDQERGFTTTHVSTPALPVSPPASPRMTPALSEQAIASLAPTTTTTTTGVLIDEHPSVGVPSTDESKRLYKSRYSSIDCYISNDSHYRDKYNDLPFAFDIDTYNTLRENKVDCLLSKHVASLFTRDPLVMFEGRIEVDDTTTTEHFESVQSTNWRSMRFKPPPLGGPIGWRVEFRTMEIQLTDFENAAYTVFLALLTRAITYFDLNFYIPLSLVDANFETAHKNDAVRKHKFHFRRRVRTCLRKPGFVSPQVSSKHASVPPTTWELEPVTDFEPYDDTHHNSSSSSSVETSPCTATATTPTTTTTTTTTASDSVKLLSPPPAQSPTEDDVCDEYEYMTIQEIMCGKTTTTTSSTSAGAHSSLSSPCSTTYTYPGLIPLVRAYLDVINCDHDTLTVVNRYLTLIEGRAKGELLTGAQWMREFVYTHPSYKQDSIVTQEIMYDLSVAVTLMANGEVTDARLMRDYSSSSSSSDECLDKTVCLMIDGMNMTNPTLVDLIHRFTQAKSSECDCECGCVSDDESGEKTDKSHDCDCNSSSGDVGSTTTTTTTTTTPSTPIKTHQSPASPPLNNNNSTSSSNCHPCQLLLNTTLTNATSTTSTTTMSMNSPSEPKGITMTEAQTLLSSPNGRKLLGKHEMREDIGVVGVGRDGLDIIVAGLDLSESN